jgi:hypothetical protein
MMDTNKKTKAQTPIRVGNAVFIRSVTHFYTGKIESVDKQSIVLSSAAWIADTGRFATAMSSGAFSEVEPYEDGQCVAVERGGIVDVCDWRHALPRVQK